MSKRKEELRSQIEHLIHDDLPLEVPGYEEENIDDVAKRATEYVDYTDTKARTLGKAKKLMDGLLKLYLSEEVIEEHEYIKAKVELDKMALSSLIFQMEAAERAIITMLRNIDDGEMHPRMFEVLGGMQKTLLDIIKSQTMYMMAAEENIKKIGRDVDVYHPGTPKAVGPKTTNSDGGISVRGTKDLMKSIRQSQEEEELDFQPPEIEDVTPEED
jgi:hypothetical protein